MDKKVFETIKKNNLFSGGDVVGVAVSGGADSMALLHFLNENREFLDIEVIAITVDHMLRGEASAGDALFVKNWCRENGILCWKFSVDAGKISQEKNIGIEEAAREARYGVFERLLEENKVDKIALAHHLSDQAETVLLHILRGSGLNGASGMSYSRNNFVRPLLDISKDDITVYCAKNCLEYVEDETNKYSKYNRNFLRNNIIPELKKRWGNVEHALINFSNSCQEDNEFILSQASFDGLVVDGNLVKIPLTYFHYKPSVINRIIFTAFSKIDIHKNVERKHIELIKELASGENGKKINLPNNIVAQKEYDYVVLFKDEKFVIAEEYPIQTGTLNFADLYNITTKRTTKLELVPNALMMDAKKVPSDAVWRTRKTGDVFTKFAGGTKTLKAYMIDRHIPSRIRDYVPILASGNEVLCILGDEISQKVKLDETTKSAYVVKFSKIVPKVLLKNLK